MLSAWTQMWLSKQYIRYGSIGVSQEDKIFFKVKPYMCMYIYIYLYIYMYMHFEYLSLIFLEAFFLNISSFQKHMVPLHYRTELKNYTGNNEVVRE